MDDDRLPWHVLLHTPGPNQDPSVNFRDAEWFPGHRGFHALLQELGVFVAAGPLPDREGAGQTVVRRISTDEITRLATQTDPAVVGGFLRVEITRWDVVESVLE